MRRRAWIGAVLLALIARGGALGGEAPCHPPGPPCFLQRVGPAGGWFPYGGGLLRWWDPRCFPRCGAPDDYCRKRLPPVCWPPYPSWYLWGAPPAGTTVSGGGCRACPRGATGGARCRPGPCLAAGGAP
jgi:hypothetical protein